MMPTFPGLDDERRPMYYKLADDHTHVPCDSIAWGALLLDIERRRVAETLGDGWRIITVFMGLDMSVLDGPPMLYESQIYIDGEVSANRLTHATWRAAQAAHAALEAAVREHGPGVLND